MTMTDGHGPGDSALPPHEEGMDGAHEAVHEMPPVYEFDDEHTHGATDVPADHNLSEDIVDESKKSKRSPALAITAAIGAIALFGGVAYWQFGGMLSPGTSSLIDSVKSTVVTPQPVKTANAPEDNLPLSPKSDSNIGEVSSLPPSQAVPVAAVAPAPQPNAAEVNTTPTPVKPVSSSSVDDERVANLNARIDTLQAQLDQANQQLSRMTAQASQNSADAASAKVLQERLDKLENDLAAAHNHNPVASQGPSAIAVSKPRNKPIIHRTTLSSLPSGFVHAPVKPSVVVLPRWVLRAAMPGQAWVAETATSPDLRLVQVGDILPGIGKVNAVRQVNGVWSVVGTMGTVN